MHTTHTTITFADHTLHIVEFDPDTFQEHDLFWLPHHTQLQHALREYGIKTVPGIGGQRQPLWPQKLFGSISHSTSTALAVVSTHPVGLDIEAIFTPQTAVELTGGIIDNSEQRILQLSPLPFPLALTLAFSAKESVYKTFSAQASELPGFASAKIVALTATHLTVQIIPSFSQNLAGQEVNVRWFQHDENIITLCEATL
ncbi:MAG: enterobactin synthase subunit EntD [Citrobacter freundii]|nr:enterobactin synthase subunit EntD [Citrobacter freundii]